MSKTNFVICTRKVENSHFVAEPGKTRYLEVPDRKDPHPVKHKVGKKKWLKRLLKRAKTDEIDGYSCGDILIFVHGYNNSPVDAMNRHDQLQKRLFKNGFKGAIVSFDWPSCNSVWNYEEDIEDALTTAHRLVCDGILVLARNPLRLSRKKYAINVHLLGHSSGALVINEAFKRAECLPKWRVDQIAFMSANLPRYVLNKSRPLVRRSTRVTNYQASYDGVLWIGEKWFPFDDKRLGLAGVCKENVAENVVNVDTWAYWEPWERQEQVGSHGWYFEDDTIATDLVQTFAGKKHKYSTRECEFDRWVLVGPRPNESPEGD